jgi:hypothetical protein
MNLVNLIQDQLTGGVMNNITSLTDGNEAQAKSTVKAGVPALLSALSGMASSGGGSANKLASTLNQFSPGSLENVTGTMAQEPTKAVEQGNDLLGSLLGGNTLSGLAAAVARFAGLDSGTVKKLLAYVSPLVLGAIGKQFQGRPATVQGLQSLFAEQKSNIAAAMPAGLSLANVPGLPQLGPTVTSVGGAPQKGTYAAEPTSSPVAKTLLPLAVLALLAALAWWWFSSQRAKEAATPAPAAVPAVQANVTRLTGGLNSVYATATQTLDGITDAASAEAALPTLNRLNSQIDGLTPLWEKLPGTARSTVAQITTNNIGKLNDSVERVLAIPGASEKLGPVLDEIVSKLKIFGAAT